MALTHLSLFSGIGGLDLAAEWAGFETVGQCEWADYPTKVLEKHWPNVPRWRDIRTLTGENFHERTGLRTVDIISGGFPCQPFSVAGKQKGTDDDRYLWPEMLRVIREIKPTWVIGENAPGILRIAGRTVCEDLEREGYAVTVLNFEAAAVGAKHRRERVFFVAHSCRFGRGGRDNANVRGQVGSLQTARPSSRCEQGFLADAEHYGFTSGEITGCIDQRSNTNASRQNATGKPSGCCCGTTGCNDVADTNGGLREQRKPQTEPICRLSISCEQCGEDVPHAKCEGLEGYDINSSTIQTETVRTNLVAKDGIHRGEQRAVKPELGGMVDGLSGRLHGYWRVEPNIPRVATGVKNRVDRLKCLGNAVVPQQAYPIFAAIAQIEMEV